VGFDPERISYDEILSAFWNAREDEVYTKTYPNDDPHRAVIFYTSASQKETAEQAIASLHRARAFGGLQISVQIQPLERFFPALGVFQRYPEKKEN
jgi:peptide-methionine (S)-S-oxide reductase